jgi:hypothetical protein
MVACVRVLLLRCVSVDPLPGLFSPCNLQQQALSLWNCTRVGSASYLTYDLSLRCEGDEYRRMSAFNVASVVGVVVGWPAFIVWYLRRVQLQGRTADESVLSRVGFLFEQYRPEYLYWDVVETVRKLYLVTVVAFFESGSQLQLVLSVIISSIAFAYHVYALPYTDRWLNLLQGACLFMIWASLQAGMLMVTTQPSLGAGSALLTAISVANIVMLISPALLVVLAVCQVIPASVRARISIVMGMATAPHADEGGDDDDGDDAMEKDDRSNRSLDGVVPEVAISTTISTVADREHDDDAALYSSNADAAAAWQFTAPTSLGGRIELTQLPTTGSLPVVSLLLVKWKSVAGADVWLSICGCFRC